MFSLEKVIGIYNPIIKYRNPMSIIILRIEQDFIFVRNKSYNTQQNVKLEYI